MKVYTLSIATLLALSGAVSSTYAQPAPAPVPDATVTLPASLPPGTTVVIMPTQVTETKVNLPDTIPRTPQSPQDARKEAVNAYAQMKSECRGDASCLKQARDDYQRSMAKSGSR